LSGSSAAAGPCRERLFVAPGWLRMRRSRLAGGLLASAFWSVLGDAAAKGLMLLSMILVARILGREEYGQFGMVRSTVNLFAIFGGMGLGLTANRYVAQFRETAKSDGGEIIGSSYTLAAACGAVAGAAVFASSGAIATRFLGAPQLEGPLSVSALLLLLSAVNGAQLGILQGLGAYRALAAGSLLQGVAALGCFTAGASWFGLNGAIAALLVYTAAGVAVLHALIARETAAQGIPVAYFSIRKVAPVFWRFSIPAALTGIAVAPFKWLAEGLLARRLGFEDLGVFNAALTVATVIVAGVSTLNAPLITAAANAGRPEGGGKLQYWNLYASWYVFLLVALPLLAAPGMAAALFGAGYDTPELRGAILLMIPYCGLLLYYQGIVRMLVQRGSLWLALQTNLCEGVSLLLGYLALARFGARGLAGAYVCSYLVRVAVTLPVLARSGAIERALLFDRRFALSAAVFAAAVLARLAAGV
jgi:O-antigen/teichoic acid export membrane protein